MSSTLIRTLPRRILPSHPPSITAVSSAFSTSAVRNTGFSSRHENDGNKLEQAKAALLQKHKDGNPDWHEDLASDSEAFIKATRSEIKHEGEEIKKLEKETKEWAEKTANK